MPEAYICDFVRTPDRAVCRGALKDVRADDLAAQPIRALMERNGGRGLGGGGRLLSWVRQPGG